MLQAVLIVKTTCLTAQILLLQANFEKLCLHDQDILANESRWTKVLALIPDEGTVVHV